MRVPCHNQTKAQSQQHLKQLHLQHPEKQHPAPIPPASSRGMAGTLALLHAAVACSALMQLSAPDLPRAEALLTSPNAQIARYLCVWVGKKATMA